MGAEWNQGALGNPECSHFEPRVAHACACATLGHKTTRSGSKHGRFLPGWRLYPVD
jgi:hypothetical protein